MNNKGYKLLLVSIFSLGIINCSGGGSDSSPDPEPVNQKPTANAGADQTIDEQSAVTVEGSGTDNDGTIASYSWAQTSGPDITLSNTDQQNLEFTAPVAKQAASLEFTLTVTDNDGATDTDIVKVTVNPVEEKKVTLQGLVTDGPIANAEVTAEVAGRTYTTTADTNGNYTLEIGADEDEDLSELLVILTADGVEDQSHVKLKSIVDSFGNILEQAGDDLTLTADENNAVKITHLSTAVAAQLKYYNDNIIPASVEEVSRNTIKLDGQIILSMATMIKFIVDYGDTNPEAVLPENVSDTWALVSDINNYREYSRSDLSFQSEVDLNISRKDTLESLTYSAPITEVPPFYIHTSSERAPGEYYEFNGGSSVMYIKSTKAQQGSWVNDGSMVKIALPEGKVIQFSRVFKGSYYVDEEKIFEEKSLRLVKSFNNVDIVIEKTDGYYHYPANPEFDDLPFEEYQVAVMTKETIPLNEEEVIGQLMLPMMADFLVEVEEKEVYPYGTLTNSISYQAGSFEITASGMVYNELPQLGNGTWNINANGRLMLNLNGGALEVIKISEHYVAVITKDVSMNYQGFLASDSALRTTSTLWDENNIAGLYELEGSIGSADLNFLVYLKGDNTGYQASGSDENGNGIVEDGEYTLEPLEWKLEGGKVVVDRYRDMNDDYCASGTEGCFIFNRRVMDLFEIDGDDFYAINKHSFNYHPLFYNDPNPELQNFWMFESYDTRSWKKHPEGTLQFP